MGNKLSKSSKEKLDTCDPRLQLLVLKTLEIMDIKVLCGFRGEEEQNKAYNEGNSRLMWGESKHNKTPSMAVDIAPYPIDWNDIGRFERMCGIIEGLAKAEGISIRLGRDFSFKDYPHIEILEN